MAREQRVGPAGIAAEFLAFDDITLRLGGKHIFRHFNWTWRREEQWAVLGTNGSGKSLLVQALMGKVPLGGGEVRGPGSQAGLPEIDPGDAMAVVSPQAQQDLALRESTFYQSRWHHGFDEGEWTVADFLSLDQVREINPFEVAPQRGNAAEFARLRRAYVRWMGIRDLLNRRVAHLSNGEIRKALLVRALLRRPRLLILEDPYAGLDPATRKRLGGVLDRLLRAGWPVLLLSHRPEDIPALTTHVLALDERGMIGQGLKATVLRQFENRLAAPGGTPAAVVRPRRSSRNSAVRSPTVPLVELRDVSVVAGRKRILWRLTWTIRRGEQWALFGPNGAGKTTLLNLIQGDHPQAYAQDLRLFGRASDSTQAVWEARRQIGWLSPELHFHYPPDWPVLDVVCSGYFNSLGLFESCSRRQRAAARRWLTELNLAGESQRCFGELSFGRQRLVLLARAVVKRPRLLILDEACQGLDAPQRRAVLAAVDHLVAQTGASLIFTTHHAGERPRCITRVLRLKAGRVVRGGPASRLPATAGRRWPLKRAVEALRLHHDRSGQGPQ